MGELQSTPSLYLFFSFHINAIFLTGTLRDSKRKEIWRAFTSNFKHMMFRGNSQIPPKLDGWVSERKVKIELFFSVLVAASLLAYKTQVSGAPQMIMISMIALAIFSLLISHTRYRRQVRCDGVQSSQHI